jgi:microcystin-dependent protein
VSIAPDPPLWLQNEQYPARLDRQLIAAVLPEGIVRGLAVSPNTPAPNYTVAIAEGMACIHGDDEEDQGAYLALLPEPASVTFAAPAGMFRTDLVVLRVNDSQAGGAAGDNTTVEVIAGTGVAGTPAPPTLPPTAIPLMQVSLTPSTTAITAAEMSGLVRPFARGVGILEEFAGPMVPTWGLVCDGRAVSRADYADLFSVIGTSWGVGNGSTTFNIPNFRGRGAVCIDTADALFSAVGRVGGSKNAVVVAHVHPITHDHPQVSTNFAGTHDHAYQRMVESATKGAGSQNAGTSLETVRTGDAGSHQHTANVPNFTGNSGAAAGGVSGANANLPPFAVVNYLIRV